MPLMTFYLGTMMAVLAYIQVRIANAKLRLELYERRWSIYEAAVALYQLRYEKTELKETEVVTRFRSAVRESRYLFMKVDGIFNLLHTIEVKDNEYVDFRDLYRDLENRLERYLSVRSVSGA